MAGRIELDGTFAGTNQAGNCQTQLTDQHGAHEPHEAFGLAEFAASNRLHDDYEDVVHPIIDVLRAQFALQKETRASGQIAVERLLAQRVARADLVDHSFPVHVGMGGSGALVNFFRHRSTQPNWQDSRAGLPRATRLPAPLAGIAQRISGAWNPKKK